MNRFSFWFHLKKYAKFTLQIYKNSSFLNKKILTLQYEYQYVKIFLKINQLFAILILEYPQ